MRANRQGTAETLRRRDDVFARLSRRCPTSLSSCAFDAVAARLQEEEAQCTFVPHVNHTFDAALMPWAAESDVFTRLFGHAKCQQQQQEDKAKVKQKADAVEMEEWRSKFRHMSFPKHLYTCPRPKGRHAVSPAANRIAAQTFPPTASTPKRGTHIISALHTDRRLADGAAVLSLARTEIWLSRMRTAYLSHAHSCNVQEALHEHCDTVCEWPKES
nr:unnamed protein product [Leishmania braziliensis]CAJ2470682.1 unnamed protein product [Leishmania braziliensis]